jgi:aminoglycoside/choline kinase family phosphotransferase
MKTIPTGPEAITARWLTQVLCAAGVIHDAQVTALAITRLGDEQSMTSQLARLHLSYDRAEPGAPSSLIAKFPTHDPQVRDFLFTVTQHYAREYYFFTQVADKVPIRIPKYYYGALDLEVRQSVLLLEDLGPAQVIDASLGCSPDQAEVALRALAQLHMAWWQQPALTALTPIAFGQPSFAQQVQVLYQEAWPSFCVQMGSSLSSQFKAIGERLGQRVAALYAQLQQPPCTLLHNDVHLGNMIFGLPDSNIPFALIDWQLLSVGRGAFDLAGFFCKDMTIETRRQAEEGLLRLYTSLLQAQDIHDYPWECCLLDYRRSLLKCFANVVVASVKGNLNPQQKHNLFEQTVPRFGTAILDHDAGSLLPA